MVENGERIPELQIVAEKVPYITKGRVARKLSVELIKRYLTPKMVKTGLFPTREVKGILTTIPEENSTPWRIIRDHLLPIRNRLFLIANTKAHPDMWMRDFKYSSEFIDNPLLHDNILKTFEDRQRLNGQIPTAVGILGSTPWHFADDESTLLYIISAAELAKRDRLFLTEGRKEKILKAYDFVRRHAFDGKYVSPAGERRGWVDAFIYPKSDINTHTQGLYAISLMSLCQSGFEVSIEEIGLAKEAYRKMAEPYGYLPLSARFNKAVDATVLYPEYLAINNFGENLLSDDIVSNTITSLVWSKHGIKVLTASPNGEYFDPKYFITGYKEGDYQNGGVWPLWHNNALVVGRLHRIDVPKDFREDMLAQLEETQWPEYIKTGGEYEEKPVPMRPWHVWNVAIIAHQKNLDTIAA